VGVGCGGASLPPGPAGRRDTARRRGGGRHGQDAVGVQHGVLLRYGARLQGQDSRGSSLLDVG
jgi:hypothetical protein